MSMDYNLAVRDTHERRRRDEPKRTRVRRMRKPYYTEIEKGDRARG